MKRELSQKVKLSLYSSIFVPTLTYGYQIWVVAERMRSQIQMAEMGFHCLAGLSLADRVWNLTIRMKLVVELLLLSALKRVS